MSARIDVVNYALVFLGEKRITSLEDESDEALIMKTLYYIARDAVLEEANWTFATRRFTPAALTEAPEWGWSTAYEIPSDIMRVTRVLRQWSTASLPPPDGNYPSEYQSAHVIEGNQILSNDTPIYCMGVRRMEDEGGYSAQFAEAFSFKLSVLASFPLAASAQKQSAALALYTDAIKRAKTRDNQQNTTRRIRNHTLANSR
jgi:hypothetical protein